MFVKKSSLIAYVLSLFTVLFIGTSGGCGDNYLDNGMLPQPGDDAKEITRFTVNGVDGTITGTSIALQLPSGTALTNLVPTIVHTGAAVTPASGVPKDFSTPVTYTVIAVDGSTQPYVVTITTSGSDSKDITRFTLAGVDGTINGTSIAVTVPFGTNIINATPTIVHTGVSINPPSGVALNFSTPKSYTVTAANGSTKTYSVSVTVALNSAKEIVQFNINGVDGTISGTAISVVLPAGTDLTSLAPTIVHTGIAISPGSGVTKNFTSAVQYVVMAADTTTKTYTVNVSIALSSSKDITRFTILGIDGTISGTSISLQVPFGTSLASLTPTVIHTGTSVSPTSGVAQNFTGPVQYTVTAADGSTKTYTVNVTAALNSAKDITSFVINGVSGTIAGTSITLTLPFGTDLSNLTPVITHTGASINPLSGAPQSFVGPVQYIVTAADATTKTYFVTVTAALDSSKDITRFTINGVDGVITANTIALTLPFGTNLASLTPFIVHTGASVSPASGVPQSFTGPRQYVVTAMDGSTKTYTVTVGLALDTSKDIIRFTILGVDGSINGTNISVTLPFGTSLTSLTPTITITGVSVSPASGVAQDFSSARQYVVTAMDGSTKTYTVTVSAAQNSSKDITSFVINGVSGVINGTTINVLMPFGTNVASLSPAITHTGVSVSPASGVPQDFTNPVSYTVTAADGSTKTYTATVGVAVSNTKNITRFTILGIDGTIGASSITLTVPFGTSRASLTPTITHNGVSITPASGVAQNFTGPVNYTVTAADGSTKTYTVFVSVAPSNAKDITQFTILGVNGTIGANTISLTVPFGSNKANLTPTTILHTGASVSPAAGVAQNFTNPVVYTVTAADGSMKQYTVTVTVALSSAKDITQFTILGVNGTIGANTIALTVPFGTDKSSLTPTTITHTGASVSPGAGAMQDFTNPVVYTVTADDGTMKPYTVTVSVALNSAKDITQFTILGVNGTIGANTISLTVPFGSNKASLTPTTITHTGASVSPGAGTAQDFTNPVTYTVTAADGTTHDYTVTVSVALNSAKDITQFTILGVNGTIGTNTITLTVPFGTNKANLTPTTILHTGASVSPGAGAAQDFTNPVVYTVTAADGTMKPYTVTVTVALNSAKDITQFTILGINGTIGTNTITLTVPFGTDKTSLIPTTITHTGASVSPGVGVAQDFTNPVSYTVTADDGTMHTYAVTVSVALNSAKDITRFTILGTDGTIGASTITLTVPFGTSKASLTPTIIHTGASVSPGSGAATDFTNPVIYTVTADDGTTHDYTVTINVALNSAKDITKFTILGIDGTITGQAISLTVPFGTSKANLTPTIIHTGDSISPASGAAQDFTGPVDYTVTAADGTTKLYTVTVSVALNSAKDITQFQILGTNGTIGSNTITLTVPFGTNKANLTPTIIHTGASVSPGSGAATDFTNPVLYTVTADDGTTHVYTVTVNVALNSAKDITKFTILGIDGTIGTNTISLTVPFGTNKANLTPTIIHTGDSITPDSGVPNNFTNPATYTVTAADGTMKTYTVTVNVALNSAKDITQFTILGTNGTIGANTITLTLPFGTSKANLTPTIVHTGASVSPDSGVANDFTNPVLYTVVAADGTTHDYTVTVSVALNNAKDITKFTINGVDGVIAGQNITVTLPFGTPVTALTPTIIHTGASINPGSGVTQDFTSSVNYTVTAADGTMQTYTASVVISANSAKDITSFVIAGVSGVIGANTITVALPAGTNKAALTPTITHTGASINPGSGVVQDFTNPVIYTVTAADGSTHPYTVTVTVAASSTKDILTFSINGTLANISGLNITLTLPFGTNPASLTPVITHNGASINPASGVAGNFTGPVQYTVTAEDGSTAIYTVVVTIASGDAKDIIRFVVNGIDGSIDQTAQTITLNLTGSISALAPIVTITGVSVAPASGATVDFSNGAVLYTVTAQNGTTKTYTVTIGKLNGNGNKLIKDVIVAGKHATSISNGNPGFVTVHVPTGTPLSLQTAIVVIDGATVSPPSGQAQNFANGPVTYVVTAVNGGTHIYQVTVIADL